MKTQIDIMYKTKQIKKDRYDAVYNTFRQDLENFFTKV